MREAWVSGKSMLLDEPKKKKNEKDVRDKKKKKVKIPTKAGKRTGARGDNIRVKILPLLLLILCVSNKVHVTHPNYMGCEQQSCKIFSHSPPKNRKKKQKVVDGAYNSEQTKEM
ncbi:hypothetical protein, unlikely [Trypanosoma brucei gambiense DAL972]|uniref:Uncharacterized protein n=1 Tax=Trypanosoma brucei gambiense (strain MHOM/CI/86/DAL972) TaxID=679716 RepID=D0A6F1_TRYB9|nr:hypothetical protein, unlikely [Trypanosoma brucei gambiense DAL972]CBH17252.1 hypothetical protein, unlikely [Trypanosoma brucei gambiense DAL972]|eukprot:XP_011779516.1 hypothetical protein, unlikely [Trypanosoma brucei gambiense DAL972]